MVASNARAKLPGSALWCDGEWLAGYACEVIRPVLVGFALYCETSLLLFA